MKFEPGGAQGGELKFLLGLAMSLLGLWFFFDSVRLTTGHPGLISSALHRGRDLQPAGGGGGGGVGQTVSMGIVLVPVFIGVVALFFDVRRTWAWVVTWIGVGILLIEIVSRMRPEFHVKASHAILMLVLIAGGLGLMLRAYVEDRSSDRGRKDDGAP
ncbi:MAG: hypothetical protein JNJ70_23220 [Verrucomicrobiales bacterium]|nr:hypothetical protein [Verrucomicrobiales bacterium]